MSWMSVWMRKFAWNCIPPDRIVLMTRAHNSEAHMCRKHNADISCGTSTPNHFATQVLAIYFTRENFPSDTKHPSHLECNQFLLCVRLHIMVCCMQKDVKDLACLVKKCGMQLYVVISSNLILAKCGWHLNCQISFLPKYLLLRYVI